MNLRRNFPQVERKKSAGISEADQGVGAGKAGFVNQESAQGVHDDSPGLTRILKDPREIISPWFQQKRLPDHFSL